MRHERNLELKEARAQQTKQQITKQAFANLLFVSIAEKLAYFFNSFSGIFLRTYNLKEEYRTQHKDARLVEGMPLFENVTMALLSAAMPLIGSDAVWLSFPATELICIAIIAATVFKHAGKMTFKLDDWLKVDNNFGKAPTLERAFHSMAGVVTEELAGNVLTDRCGAFDYQNTAGINTSIVELRC